MFKFRTILSVLLSISLLLCVNSHSCYAQIADSTSYMMEELSIIKKQVSMMKIRQNAQNKEYMSRLLSEEEQITFLRDSIEQVSKRQSIVSLDLADRLSIAENKSSELSNRVARLATIMITSMVFFILVFAILLMLMFFKRKRDNLKNESERESYLALESRIVDLINTMPEGIYHKEGETNHAFILKIANEITKMEMNLRHMSPDTRGYKQLIKAIERLKDNFRANDYEIVDLLGKTYDEGMVVKADFKEDDTLPEGSQIITGITTPQVNHRGKMIQSAQITVSQN